MERCECESDTSALLNELVCYYRRHAVDNQSIGLFYIAERYNKQADLLFSELDQRGYYDDVLNR